MNLRFLSNQKKHVPRQEHMAAAQRGPQQQDWAAAPDQHQVPQEPAEVKPHGPKQWQLGNGFAANEQILELSNPRQGPAVHGKSTAAAEGRNLRLCRWEFIYKRSL